MFKFIKKFFKKISRHIKERGWLYRLTCFLVFPIRNWKVSGKENIPQTGPYIIVANHIDDVDPWKISVRLPLSHWVYWLGKKELVNEGEMFKKFYPKLKSKFIAKVFSRLICFYMRHSFIIPVDRENPAAKINREAVVRAMQILRSGGIIGIFSEGGTKRNEVHTGAVIFAKKIGVPIVLVKINKGWEIEFLSVVNVDKNITQEEIQILMIKILNKIKSR